MRPEEHQAKRQMPTPPVVKTKTVNMYSPEGDLVVVNEGDRAQEYSEKGYTDTPPVGGGKRGSK